MYIYVAARLNRYVEWYGNGMGMVWGGMGWYGDGMGLVWGYLGWYGNGMGMVWGWYRDGIGMV